MTLRADQLVKRFRRNAVLDHLDFELKTGSVTVLLGRNGAGKSTFMKLALGLLKPNGGSIEVCGYDPARHARAVRRTIGYVPDKPDVYGWMSPDDLFRFLRPQYPTWNRDTVERLGDMLCVPTHRPFSSLSRGEGMKAMLVAALAHEPELLLLDEPFAGLDPIVREEVLRGVIDELRSGERTVLCATHDLDVASRIADEIAVLQGGRIVSVEPNDRAPREIKQLMVEITT